MGKVRKGVKPNSIRHMQRFANDLKHSKYLFESALGQLDSKSRLCISLIFFSISLCEKKNMNASCFMPIRLECSLKRKKSND